MASERSNESKVNRRRFLKVGAGAVVVAAAAAGGYSYLSQPGPGPTPTVTTASSAATASATQSLAPVALAYWKGDLGKPQGDVESSIIANFQKMHPNITVGVTTYPWIEYREKLFTIFSFGGANPDLLVEGIEYPMIYASMGALENLEPYVKEWEDDGVKVWDQIPEEMKPWHYYGDQLVQVFTGIQPWVLAYNAKLFEKVGLDPNSPPTTWDELHKILPVFHQKDPNLYGYAVRTDISVFCEFCTMFWQLGGEITKGLTTGPRGGSIKGMEITLNSDAGVKAMEELLKRAQYAPGGAKGLVGVAGSQARNLFGQEVVANEHIMGHQFGLVASLAKDSVEFAKNLRIAQSPIPEGGKNTCWFSGNSDCITKLSAHKDESWEFIKYYLNKENQMRMLLEGPAFLPIRKDIASDPRITDPNLLTGIKAGKTGIPSAGFIELNTVWDVLRSQVEAMFLGQKTPEQAINDAVATMYDKIGG
jgi:multiple sugar transport system substrate-binding protein